MVPSTGRKVQRLSHQFLANTAFTADDNVQIALGNMAGQRLNTLHSSAVSNENAITYVHVRSEGRVFPYPYPLAKTDSKASNNSCDLKGFSKK
jgi:hypothetical protein